MLFLSFLTHYPVKLIRQADIRVEIPDFECFRMNVGVLGHNFLQTASSAQTAQGLQPAVSAVSQSETLTRINSTQNTSSAENKPNSQNGDGAKNADEVANQYQRLGKNVKNYKDRGDQGKEEKHSFQGSEESQPKSADNPQGLSEEDVKEVKELSKRDREVRTHEQAHMATAGQYAKGAIHFETETGPDGKTYAVGGHVSIDTSPVPDDPQATIQKANKIRAAAMAPAEPSSQDRAVAAEATRMAAEAQADLAKQRQSERKTEIENDEGPKAINEQSASEQKEHAGTSEYKKVAGLDISLNEQPRLFSQVA